MLTEIDTEDFFKGENCWIYQKMFESFEKPKISLIKNLLKLIVQETT